MNVLPIQKPKMIESNFSRDHEKPKAAKRKNRYLSSGKKKKISGRKCKICGKDAYPNYFFCPSCHHRISSEEETDTIAIRLEE